ncbi:erythromycin esterase family protein [Herbidospora sp. NEAU-GS84]|uniref:Erythromycin esterase family protein n=2 Tax=Herbidospora solisilvae TaxID=2696284 RepID=A0A7C9NDQ4_9ACTN|nr:erythromycin esterase family protein [Herbidospora solisilvae]
MLRLRHMSQDIRDFVPPSCELLGLGEPTHGEPAFGWLRNDLFDRLTGLGFRSIALEIDRVAALAVDDYVQGGPGSLDAVMRDGFSHGWGAFAPNRALVAWMRDHNAARPPEERLTFHGFDAPTENTTAPSPRAYLEHARDHLGLDLDLAGLLGDDERWGHTDAIMDPARSPGATPEADRARVIADEMLARLHERAPESPRAAWLRARTHLTAGIGLLRYHRQAAIPLDQGARISLLLATRDAIMAQNLFDIRDVEARRGRTLVFSHNLHLKKTPSSWHLGDKALTWHCAGEIVASLWGDRYAFIAAGLGRSTSLGLGEPAPDTYEGDLGRRFPTWGLTTTMPTGVTRTDTTPQMGYFPLAADTFEGADALLHIADGTSLGR